MGLLSPELEAFIPRFVQIESGGDPNAKTGSYTGLLQMGPDEIAKYGGNGLEQGKALLADRAAELEKTLGRPPTPTELYLAHQQGLGGATAHLSNPDNPAWQNMYSTAEGQKKGEAWAKKAIWGNMTPAMKAQFPDGVDSVTSRDFTNLWQQRVEGTQTASLPPQPLGAPVPFQPQKPLPPQPLNLASQPMGSLPAYNFTPGQQPEAQPTFDTIKFPPVPAPQIYRPGMHALSMIRRF